MNQLTKLEAEAKRLDRRVVASLSHGYDFYAADSRDLLGWAAQRIRELEAALGSEKAAWLTRTPISRR